MLRFKRLIEETGDLVTKLLSTLQLCIRFHDPYRDSGFEISRKVWLREQTKIQGLGFELRRRREQISSLLTVVSAYVLITYTISIIADFMIALESHTFVLILTGYILLPKNFIERWKSMVKALPRS